MRTWIASGRHLGTAALASALAGTVVGGLLGRVVMRVSGFTAGPALVGVTTSNGNRVGDITFAGTAILVIFVALAAGVLGGVVYAVVEPWLRRLRPWHGLAYGVALLLAFGFSVLEPTNFDFKRFGMPALNVAMFAALFVLFGVVTAWLFEGLQKVRAGTGRAAQVVDILAWMAVAPVVLAAGLAAVSVGGLDAPLYSLLVVAALVVAVLVRWRGLPLAIGYASLVGAMLLGAARLLPGLPNLLTGF
ncbi:MAG: hypothetical protein ABJB39_06015 [Chloroflexota bacterium]